MIMVVSRMLAIAAEVKTYGARVRTEAEAARVLRTRTEGRLPWYIIKTGTKLWGLWHAVMGLLIVYVAVIVPYRVCFLVEAQGGEAVVEHVVYAAFVVDLVLNFFMVPITAHGNDVKPPTTHRAIVTTYLKGWFILDFAATLPVDYLTFSDGWVLVGRTEA